jgi:hypothetical protein
MSRFVIYYGIILSLIKKNVQYALIAVGIALFGTIVMSDPMTQRAVTQRAVTQRAVTQRAVTQQKATLINAPNKHGMKETQDVSTTCPNVSVNNYMGNPIIGIHNNVDKHCEVNQEQIKDVFLHNLPTDHWDIYGKNNSQRQFYTVPVNDQSAFAKWLYDPDIVMTCDKTQKAC